MKYLALVSGGKDSVYSIQCLQRGGHELVCLLYMKNDDKYQDSYMYQTIGSEVAQLLGECLDVPIFTYKTECRSINQDLVYKRESGDEVEDLYDAISMAKRQIHFEGVCSGAILSQYQKNRVEDVCRRLCLQSLAPLWKAPQKELLMNMILEGMDARVVKIASSFMGKECINMSLTELFQYLEGNSIEMNFCGEGGEYETVVLDCPLFKKRIVLHDHVICGHPEEVGREGTVFYMKILGCSMETK